MTNHWSKDPEVLLGLPAYQDEDVAYHDPKVENLRNALLGIHSSLSQYKNLPENYQGIAIYCEWEMDSDKWQILKDHFRTTVTHLKTRSHFKVVYRNSQT